MGWLYIGIILIFRGVQSQASKGASGMLPGEVRGRTLYLVYYQGVACLLALVALLFSGGFAAIDGITAFLATITGVFLTLSSLLSLLALKTGTLALGTFASSAGLIIPAAAGIFLFDEPLSLWQWGGVALMLCSAFLLGSSSKEQKGTFSLKTVWILRGSMAATGAVMRCQKYLAERVPAGSVSAYSFLTFLIPALALGIFLAVPSKQPLKPLDRRLYLYGGLLAVAVFVINQLATLAASLVDSVVLFGFINGGATVIAAVVGAAVYKEILTVKSTVGILLGVVSMIVIKAL